MASLPKRNKRKSTPNTGSGKKETGSAGVKVGVAWVNYTDEDEVRNVNLSLDLENVGPIDRGSVLLFPNDFKNKDTDPDFNVVWYPD